MRKILLYLLVPLLMVSSLWGADINVHIKNVSTIGTNFFLDINRAGTYTNDKNVPIFNGSEVTYNHTAKIWIYWWSSATSREQIYYEQPNTSGNYYYLIYQRGGVRPFVQKVASSTYYDTSVQSEKNALAAAAEATNKSNFETALSYYGGNPGHMHDQVVNSTAFNYVTTYLKDYPTTNNNVYTKIQAFFDENNVPKTGIVLADLQKLLNHARLNNFLNTTQQGIIAGLRNRVNFIVALNAVTGTAGLKALIDNASYKTAAYLAAYPSATDNCVYTKLQGFLDADTTLADVTLKSLLTNANLNNFLNDAQKTALSPLRSKLTFGEDLANVTTPDGLNTLINDTKYSSLPVGGLANYPSPTNNTYVKIQSFFTNNEPTVATNATALKTLLQNTNLNKFLSATQVEAAKALLNRITFKEDLVDADTLAKLNSLVTKYPEATYLANYPSETDNIFKKIEGYFTNNEPTVATNATALKTLLNNANLKYLLTPTQQGSESTSQQGYVSTWSANINLAVEKDTEKDRVNEILVNIGSDLSTFSSVTVTSEIFATPLGKIKTLAESVAAKLANDPNLVEVYDSTIQTAFCNKLTDLHNARPKTDLATLTNLSALYSSLKNNPLSGTSCDLDNKITDIANDSQQLEISRVLALLATSFPSKTTYSDKFAFLQDLAKEVKDANFSFDYGTDVKATFETALGSLHESALTEIKEDKAKLEELMAWYNTLKTPLTLLANDTALDTKITAIQAEINRVTDPTLAVKAEFSAALTAITTPSALYTLMVSGKASNNVVYNTVSYLKNYPANAFLDKIKSFFDSNKRPTVTGTELSKLRSLLRGSKLAKFLTTNQIKSLTDHLVYTELFFANANTNLKTRCDKLKSVIKTYKGKYKNKKLPAAISTYLFTNIMGPIYSKIMGYGKLTSTQKTERNKCVALFKTAYNKVGRTASGGCSFTSTQKASTLAAITNLNKKK
jgi:hypothetical protein